MNTPWYYKYVLAAMRRIQRWGPEHKACRKAALVAKEVYKCAKCKADFPRKETAVDHMFAVIDPSVGFCDWNTFFSRLFCAADGLQVLCKACHKAKSNSENVVRREIKRRAKQCM